MKIYDWYIFEILIHLNIYPNLVVKLAKMVVKNDVIFGTPHVISRHNLNTPSPPKPMKSFVNNPLYYCR